MPKIDLAYYGDDFTGSTDVLETLSLGGLPTSLFVDDGAITSQSLPAATRAVGIAGLGRTMSPAEMDAQLPAAYQALARLNPRFVHYKTCSTFDSSPTVGSVGRAIEIGRREFGNRITPLVVGAPALGRYCAFGNLFAKFGLDGGIFRLDRHPSMSRHPVTPMDEADLTRHLAKQTATPISLIDILTLNRGAEAALAEVDQAPDGVVLFDAIQPEHLQTIGTVLDALQRRDGCPLFVVGSSGVDAALVSHWNKEASSPTHGTPPVASALTVVSGSRSPVTARQISYAKQHGFTELVIDDAMLGDSEPARSAAESLANRLAAEHDAGRSTILRTGDASSSQPGQRLGAFLGQVLLAAMRSAHVRRVVVAGGDTSGVVARTLGIGSLEMVAPLTPGAPLCRVRSDDQRIDGVEFVFKGGQVGRDDFFVTALRGAGIAS